MTPDPIEELRKCANGEGWPTFGDFKQLFSAYDAMSAKLEQALNDIQQLETGKYGRRELHAQIDKLIPELASVRAELKQAHEDRIKAQDAMFVAKAKNDRLHRVLNHIASHGIHTDRVDAHITMSMADQKEDLVTVLEREIQW